MTVVLDGAYMTERSAAHEYLKRQLQLPDYYGNNLDALYDVLSSFPEDLEVELAGTDLLDAYGEKIIQTIEEAAADNPRLRFVKKDC